MKINALTYDISKRKLAAEISTFNDDAAKYQAAVKSLETPAVIDGESIQDWSGETLAKQTTDRRAAELKVKQEAIRLCTRRAELLEQIVSELQAGPEKAEAAYATEYETVAQLLKEAGCGPDSTVAGRVGTNPAAADHQFHHLVSQSLRVSKLNEALENAKAQSSRAVGELRQASDEIAAAKSVLRQFVSSQVNSAPVLI